MCLGTSVLNRAALGQRNKMPESWAPTMVNTDKVLFLNPDMIYSSATEG